MISHVIGFLHWSWHIRYDGFRGHEYARLVEAPLTILVLVILGVKLPLALVLYILVRHSSAFLRHHLVSVFLTIGCLRTCGSNCVLIAALLAGARPAWCLTIGLWLSLARPLAVR